MIERHLPDGRVLYVFPLIMGTARLGISVNAEVKWFEDVW